VILPQNGKPGKNENGTLKSIAAIWLEKIRLSWGVPLASEIGGHATSSNMNGSVVAVKLTESRSIQTTKEVRWTGALDAPFCFSWLKMRKTPGK